MSSWHPQDLQGGLGHEYAGTDCTVMRPFFKDGNTEVPVADNVRELTPAWPGLWPTSAGVTDR